MLLSDLLGIRLLVWIGSTVPFPPGGDVIAALKTAEVVQQDDGDGFQLTFELSKDQLLDFPLLRDGSLALFNRVTIGVITGVVPELLINGAITHHQLEVRDEPGGSTLTVTGKDLSVLLDLEEKNVAYPNRPDFAIVSEILLKNADTGIVPGVIIPTTDLPIELQRIPRQAETDLGYIRRLARRNGYVFNLSPRFPGVSTADFGPETRLSLPLPALVINSGSADNVDSLHFANDGLAPETTEGAFIEPISKTVIPILPVPSLRLPPVVFSPTSARRTVQLRETAKESASRALVSAAARTTNAPEAVTGTGKVDTTRYGSVMRARGLIGVRGAGISYDGFYYLRSVTHRIERGKYTQEFTITREGTGSLVPAVVP